MVSSLCAVCAHVCIWLLGLCANVQNCESVLRTKHFYAVIIALHKNEMVISLQCAKAIFPFWNPMSDALVPTNV